MNYNNLSSWRETIKNCRQGITEIDFLDTKPNMFVIQNPNKYPIRIGISKIPTRDNYEMIVTKNSTASFGRPIPTGKLYIYNEVEVELQVRVFSVYDVFDMGILNNINISLEDAKLETDGIVKGFAEKVSLPAGTNTLGKVDLTGDTMSQITDNFTDLMSNNDDNMAMLMNAASFTGKVNLKNLLDAINALGGGGGTASTLNGTYSISDSVGQTLYDNDAVIFKKVGMISNIGSSQLSVMVYTDATTHFDFSLEAGDFISDISLPVIKLVVVATADAKGNYNGSFSIYGEV